MLRRPPPAREPRPLGLKANGEAAKHSLHEEIRPPNSTALRAILVPDPLRFVRETDAIRPRSPYDTMSSDQPKG